MTTLRVLLSILGSAAAAMLLVVIGAMIAMIAAVGTGRRIEIPGLLLADAGRLPDLGIVQFDSPGLLAWAVALTVAASAVTFLLRRRSRQRQQVCPPVR